MPKADDMVHFKNYHKQLPVPFVIYADFEAITKKAQDCKPNSSTEVHGDCGYGYKAVCLYNDEYTKPAWVYVGKNANKLIPTLNRKEKYVLHFGKLRLYESLGLKVTKLHRALEFNQSPWLWQYINFNTEKRKNAKIHSKKISSNSWIIRYLVKQWKI